MKKDGPCRGHNGCHSRGAGSVGREPGRPAQCTDRRHGWRAFGHMGNTSLYDGRNLKEGPAMTWKEHDLVSFRHEFVELASVEGACICLLYTSPSPRDRQKSRMPSSA